MILNFNENLHLFFTNDIISFAILIISDLYYGVYYDIFHGNCIDPSSDSGKLKMHLIFILKMQEYPNF